MKKFLGILVLSLFLITPSQADDIRDFQIEGMSIGDSLLDFFSEEEINKKIFGDYPGSDKYKRFFSWDPESYEIYKGVQVNFKKNDKKYIIQSITGEIKPINIENCYERKKNIEKEFDLMFPNAEKNKGRSKKKYDKSGKSFFEATEYYLVSGDGIQINCSDWSDEMTKNEKLSDALTVALDSKIFIYFLKNEAYK